MKDLSSLVMVPPSTAKIRLEEIPFGPPQAATIQTRAKNTKANFMVGKYVCMLPIVAERRFDAQPQVTPDAEGTTVAYLNLP